MSALSSTSNAFGTVVANGRLDSHTNGIDEQIKQQVLAEEEAAMNQFKVSTVVMLLNIFLIWKFVNSINNIMCDVYFINSAFKTSQLT